MIRAGKRGLSCRTILRDGVHDTLAVRIVSCNISDTIRNIRFMSASRQRLHLPAPGNKGKTHFNA